jgi:hypothetical protein
MKTSAPSSSLTLLPSVKSEVVIAQTFGDWALVFGISPCPAPRDGGWCGVLEAFCPCYPSNNVCGPKHSEDMNPGTCNLQLVTKNMPFSPFFCLSPNRQQLPIAATPKPAELPITADSCQLPPPETAPIGTCRQLSAAIGTKIDFPGGTWCFPRGREPLRPYLGQSLAPALRPNPKRNRYLGWLTCIPPLMCMG